MHPLKFFSNKICFQQQGITTCREKSFFLREPKFISIYFKSTAANKCTYTFEACNEEGLKVKMRQGSNKHYDYKTILLYLKLRNKFDRLHFIKIFNTFCTQLRKATWYFHTKENFHQNSICNYIIKINSVGDYGRKKLIVLYKLCRQVE